VPEIVPALLGADPLNLAEAISQVARTQVRIIHLDVMDGQFVDDISFGSRTIRAVREFTPLELDVHLQVSQATKHLDLLAALRVEMITVHVEQDPHISRTLDRIGALGVRRGLALNPGTPVAAISDLLGDVEQVTVMTSNPGTSKFMPNTIDKVAGLREILRLRNADGVSIAVDGGVTTDRAKALCAAGADKVIAASAVFSHPEGIAAGVAALRSACSAGQVPDGAARGR
jgi:ribulose-phosphate 3-epimerase